jgi:nitrite reductase (NADH) large subunit
MTVSGCVMSRGATNRFRNYTEVPAQVPVWVWTMLRVMTLAIACALIVLLVVTPDLGLLLIWGLAIPLLPAIFAAAPGLWRQVCPMAFLNQLPRTFSFGRDLSLPVRVKHLAYYLSMILFFVIVSLRHITLNHEPMLLAGVLVAMLVAAFVGGVIFKGRSGWCGTFCPLAPIQRAYGQAPIVMVKNGYCPTCVGCQKNCYDFNPRAAVHSDLADPDRWYAGHKEVFIGALPGFILAFFLAESPTKIGLPLYYAYFALWMGISLGLYMALTRLIFGITYKVALAYSMAALLIFYWFGVPTIMATLTKLSGVAFSEGIGSAAWAVIALVGASVLVAGLLAEHDFKRFSGATGEARQLIGVNSSVLRGGDGRRQKSGSRPRLRPQFFRRSGSIAS